MQPEFFIDVALCLPVHVWVGFIGMHGIDVESVTKPSDRRRMERLERAVPGTSGRSYRKHGRANSFARGVVVVESSIKFDIFFTVYLFRNTFLESDKVRN